MGKGIDLSMDAFIDENELFSPSVEEENDANEQPEALEDLGLEDTKKILPMRRLIQIIYLVLLRRK